MIGYTGLAKTYIFGEVDINQLHEVINGDCWGRSCGKTFSILMRMLGEAWLGSPGNVYLYIGETREWSERVMGEFRKILEFEGFKVADNSERANDRLFVGTPVTTSGGIEGCETQLFIFWSIDSNVPELVNGWDFAEVFNDVDEPDWWIDESN